MHFNEYIIYMSDRRGGILTLAFHGDRDVDVYFQFTVNVEREW